MDSQRSLPSNVDYTAILPLAVESRSRRRSFFPTNGQSFTSNGNNIVRIDVSASAFLDPKHSYLRFRMTNNSAATMGMDFGGGHSFLRRIRIEQSGNILSDCQSYGKLLSSIILPCQGGIESVGHRSITEGVRFANSAAAGTSTAPAVQAECSGVVALTPCASAAAIPAAGGGAGSNQVTFAIPLVNGLLGTTQDKMVPLQLLGSSPLTIEIELAPIQDVGIFSADPTASSYTLDNVRYIASLVEVGPEVDQQLRMVQEMSGGRLVLNGTDYTHFNGIIPANSAGQQTINVPARRKSMKSIYFTGASQAFGTGAGGAANDAVWQVPNLSYGGNFGMTDYQMKIGSMHYPPTPVECNFGNAAGPDFQRAEALSELAKSWGTLASTAGTGILNTTNYATASGLVGTGAAPSNTFPIDAGVGADTVSFRFSPFAMDLQSFQRTALESGINSADRSLPISLIINVGAAIAQAQNVDAFVAYDSLYYIDEMGTIRVSM